MLVNEVAGTIKSIIPTIIEKYMIKKSLPWEIAIEHLYNSEFYKALENADTRLYQLTPTVLCDFLLDEKETGRITCQEVDF
jgi:hypothetical protein